MKKDYLVFFFVLMNTIFFGCSTKVKVEKQSVQRKQNKNTVIDLPTVLKFTMVKTADGKKVYKIKADKAVVDDKNKIITVYNGEAKVYDKKMQIASLKFEVAKYDIVSEDIYFLGKNIINTIEKEKIITYDIKYLYKENKIFSDKEIEIYKDNNIVKGIGFETFDGFQTIKIYKNVITTE